ncbi:hypothetical protein H9P43_009903 [Blastocladiella emersonii ATCC 22665]|nr:hypothetical protein H9P43_009903 [Blastocladiella emersonii ATCC 22665]
MPVLSTMKLLAGPAAARPTPAALAATTAAAAVAWLLLRGGLALLRNLRRRRALLAEGLSGPPLATLSDVLFGHVSAIAAAGDLVAWMTRAHRTYGAVWVSCSLLAQPVLWVADRRALRTILVSHGRAFPHSDESRARLARVTGPRGLLVLEDPDAHRVHRRVLNPVFNAKHLRELVPVVDRAMGEFFTVVVDPRVAEAGGGEAIVDLAVVAPAITLNVVGRAILSTDFDALNPARASPLYAATKAMDLPFRSDLFARLSNLFPLLRHLPVAANREFDAAQRAVTAQVDRVVAALEQGGDTTGALLPGPSLVKTLYAELRAHAEAGVPEAATEPVPRLSAAEVRDELKTFLLAGQDTTATVFSLAVWEVSQQPALQSALRAELGAAFPNGFDPVDDASTLATLPVLNAVIRETLRLHAPAPISSRKATEAADLPCDSGRTVHVARGQRLVLAIAALHRDPAIWGNDADEFKPARWDRLALFEPGAEDTETHPGQVLLEGGVKKEVPPMAYVPFLVGARVCIGRQFAVLAVQTMLARVFLKYDVEPVTQREEMKKRYAVTAIPRRVEVRLRPVEAALQQGAGVAV